MFMTPSQQQWARAVRAAASSTAHCVIPKPKHPLRVTLFTIVTSRQVEGLIMCVIMANIGVMACDRWKFEEDQWAYNLYTNANFAFDYFYYAEAVLKMTAFGFDYFRDSWCQFDFTLVCLTLLHQLFRELLERFLKLPPMLLRALRMLRVVRLFQADRGVRNLVTTFLVSIPAMLNIGSLLGIFVFMYAVLGMQLFTFVEHGEEGLTDERNFGTFGNSCLLLFQCLTGDGWSELMVACTFSPGCSAETRHCSSVLAIPYFLSFQLLGMFVLLGVLIAVMLESFAALGTERQDLASSRDLDLFHVVWGTFDPSVSGKMPAKQLPQLILSLPPPLGLKGEVLQPSPAKCSANFCKRLDLPSRGELQYQQVLNCLIQNTFLTRLHEGEVEDFRRKTSHHFRVVCALSVQIGDSKTRKQHYAAKVLQLAWLQSLGQRVERQNRASQQKHEHSLSLRFNLSASGRLGLKIVR